MYGQSHLLLAFSTSLLVCHMESTQIFQVSGSLDTQYLNHLVMLFSCSAGTASMYKAAMELHQAMWQTDFKKRLHDVNGLKYLPSMEVRNLQLEKLDFMADTILVCKDYYSTLEKLEKLYLTARGIVLIGHPGIGMSLLQKYMDLPCLHTYNMQENLFSSFICYFIFLARGNQLRYSVMTTTSFFLKMVLKCMMAVSLHGVFNSRRNFGPFQILLNSANIHVHHFKCFAK